jgi:transcriptional regulator with XRE-family HTH domain
MPAGETSDAVGVDLVWVGRQLRRLREARGVSQSELARRTGSPRTYLIALEQGRHEPAIDLLARIATALDEPLRDLLWFLAGEPFADPAAPLAARVRLRRERLGMRPAELAARAATTRATISQIERGVNANPGLGLLTRLAAALYCCPSELAPPLGVRPTIPMAPAVADDAAAGR